MSRAYIVCLFLCFTVIALAQSNTTVAPKAYVASPGSASKGAQAKILDLYGKFPLDFEENHGQVDERVKFLSRTGEYTLFLTADEIVLSLKANSSHDQAITEQIPGRGLRTKSEDDTSELQSVTHP